MILYLNDLIGRNTNLSRPKYTFKDDFEFLWTLFFISSLLFNFYLIPQHLWGY